MLGYLILGIFFLFIMVLASGAAMDAIEHLASKYSLNKLFLSTVLIGLSVALPELAIAFAASIEGVPLIALGNVMGANMANLGLVVGATVMIVGVVPVIGDYLKGSLWVTLGAIILPYLLLIDGRLSRLDGIVLVFSYLLYLSYIVRSNGIVLKQGKNIKRVISKSKDLISDKLASIIMLLLSFSVVIVSAIFLVRLVGNIATGLVVSNFWAGLVLLSIGTTLPEILGGLFSDKKFSPLLIIEKLLGSMVINSTLVIGILAIIKPVEVNETLSSGLTGLFTVVTLGLFWLFSKSRRKLNRWEGAVLLGIYFMFAGLQLMTAR